MPKAVRLHIEVVAFETGIWCDACALSSGVLVHVATTIGDRTTMTTKVACTEHGT